MRQSSLGVTLLGALFLLLALGLSTLAPMAQLLSAHGLDSTRALEPGALLLADLLRTARPALAQLGPRIGWWGLCAGALALVGRPFLLLGVAGFPRLSAVRIAAFSAWILVWRVALWVPRGLLIVGLVPLMKRSYFAAPESSYGWLAGVWLFFVSLAMLEAALGFASLARAERQLPMTPKALLVSGAEFLKHYPAWLWLSEVLRRFAQTAIFLGGARLAVLSAPKAAWLPEIALGGTLLSLIALELGILRSGYQKTALLWPRPSASS